MYRLAVLASIACCLSCASPPPEPPGSSRHAVTNGAPDASHPAVVAIIDKQGNAVCTGTLIEAHAVLTAAHCRIGLDSYDEYRVFFGADVSEAGTAIDIATARIHPDFDPATYRNDLALLTLAAAGPAAPIPIDERAMDGSFVGQVFSVVGFGVSAAQQLDQGLRRSGTARVSGIGAHDFAAEPAPSQPCVYDSGGPALFEALGTTYVGGVVSHGDAACADHAFFQRLDGTFTSFITSYLAETAPGTAAAGERCLYPEHCGAGTCVAAEEDPRVMYCATACKESKDCASGMICPAGATTCRYPLPTPGAIGSTCGSDGDCLYSECTERGVCSFRCVPGDGDCPVGFACSNLGGTRFFCMKVTPPVPASEGSSGGCVASGRSDPSDGRGLGLTWMTLVLFALGRRARGAGTIRDPF